MSDSRFRYSSGDQELISRFRYLTGKRPLGGYGYPGVPRGFDRIDYDIRAWFERHDTIGGSSLGGEVHLGTVFPVEDRGRHLDAYQPPPVPEWWDEGEDPNMTLVSDRHAEMKALTRSGRFYHPRSWPGVFPEGPQEKHEREQREYQKQKDREERERQKQLKERRALERAEMEEGKRAELEAMRANREKHEAEIAEIMRADREKRDGDRAAAEAERARVRAEDSSTWKYASYTNGWNYNPQRPASRYNEQGELLFNMRINEPLRHGQGRVWNDYVMIREEDFQAFQANKHMRRTNFPEVCRGHGKIIFRML